MAVNPSSLSATYKKNSVIPSDTIILTPSDTSNGPFGDGPWVDSKPNWLKVIYVSKQNAGGGQPDRVTYRITVNESVARTMGTGNYTGTVVFLEKNLVGKLKRQRLTYYLEIQETVVLKVTPNPLEFNTYNIGGSLPPSKFLNITTENNWDAYTEQSWIELVTTNGSGNSSIQVNVDVTGLDPGDHIGEILIDDGANTFTVNVVLPVRGEITPSEHLTVTPSAIDVSEIYQEPPTKQRTIKIDSSEAFTITDNVGWLSYSATSGSSGITNITVSTTNTETLPIGVYPATITITTSSNIKEVSVLLRITRAQVSGIESNGFYYADDRNRLSVTTDQDNAEILINFNTEASSGGIRPYSKKAPYIDNIANVIIGLETRRLLRPNPFISNLNTRVFVPVVPLRMDFTLYDKLIGQSTLTKRSEFSNVQFINGRTPNTTDVLTYLPSQITTVKNGIVCFSFKAGQPPASIEITGAITESIPVSGLTGNLFTVMVNLSDFSLSVGNNIAISCGPISVNVTIRPSDPERTRLIWLNEWDMPEIFELTGSIKIPKPREVEVTTISQEGMDYDKVIDVSRPYDYEVNSGNIYSQKEFEWLSMILESRQVYLEVNGEMTEVICTNKSLNTYQTRQFIKNYTLTFKKALR